MSQKSNLTPEALAALEDWEQRDPPLADLLDAVQGFLQAAERDGAADA